MTSETKKLPADMDGTIESSQCTGVQQVNREGQAASNVPVAEAYAKSGLDPVGVATHVAIPEMPSEEIRKGVDALKATAGTEHAAEAKLKEATKGVEAAPQHVDGHGAPSAAKAQETAPKSPER